MRSAGALAGTVVACARLRVFTSLPAKHSSWPTTAGRAKRLLRASSYRCFRSCRRIPGMLLYHHHRQHASPVLRAFVDYPALLGDRVYRPVADRPIPKEFRAPTRAVSQDGYTSTRPNLYVRGISSSHGTLRSQLSLRARRSRGRMRGRWRVRCLRCRRRSLALRFGGHR
jgi:hypothetical protein